MHPSIQGEITFFEKITNKDLQILDTYNVEMC